MALLPDAEREHTCFKVMRENADTIGILKADLRAAVNAADQWAEENAASFNAALPQPARSGLTARQKSRLLAAVLFRRFETL